MNAADGAYGIAGMHAANSAPPTPLEAAAAAAVQRRRHGLAKPALVGAGGAPAQVGVGEGSSCMYGTRSASERWSRPTDVSHARSSARASPGSRLPTAALAAVALGQQALGHRSTRAGSTVARSPLAAERADGQRHRGVRPLLGAALLAARFDAPGADVLEELGRRRGRPGPP